MEPIALCNKSGSAVQHKEKDMEKVGIASEEGTLIMSTAKKPLKLQRMMLKPSKMRRAFKWKFPM